MTSQKPPRIGMPEVSNAAHKMFAKSMLYNKPKDFIQENKIVLETCKTCSKEYNAHETTQITTNLPIFGHKGFCLNCIKKVVQQEKETTQLALKEAKQKFNKITITYKEIESQWMALAKKYRNLDYVENMLTHKQKVKESIKKPSIKKASSTEETAAKLAMKILANLSPEKRAELLALIKQQAS